MEEKVQYTVRGIDTETDKELRAQAHDRHLSVNEYTRQIITNQVRQSRNTRYELNSLRGSLEPDAEFDSILEAFNTIDSPADSGLAGQAS